MLNKVIHGDCLIESDNIESGSVDLILTDLPYGTMRGISDGETSWSRTNTDWDMPIDPVDIYAIANRILRKNGKLVLFSQEPYTARLITEAIPNIPFSYRMIWEKDIYGNALFAKKAPLIFFEDILVFSKRDCDIKNPVKSYTNKIRQYIGKPNKEIYEDFERAGFKKYAVLDTFNSDNARRYNFPTYETYKNLVSLYGIDKMEGFKDYEVIREQYIKHTPPSTFNLWEGKKYKSNILRYKKDYDGYHPTQKPLLLLEDLIKTFSNEGDLVVDLTCGSGSTLVAAKNTNRNYIGIEQEKEYVDIANKRLEKE